MKLLLKTIRKRAGSDETSTRETILEGREIHVGRAVSMEICLPDIGVDFQHATIEMVEGKLVMKATSPGGIKVGGQERDQADLGSEAATIGRFTFRGEAGRDGADAAVTMEEEAADAAPTHDRKGKKRDLEDVLPSRRLLAWVFSIAIIGVFLVWPMLDVMKRPGMSAGAEAPAVEVVDGMARKDLPHTTPMEIAWSSGPLSKAHQMIENDCAACHQRPFEMTQNVACLSCHAMTENHSDVEAHPALALENTRCAACHKEHNGGDAPVETASSACVGCHQNITSVSADSKLDNITGFGDNHPAFQIALVTAVNHSPETGVTAEVKRVPFTAGTTLQENSGLKFPHSKHMVEGGVRSPNGKKQLQCANCHELEPGGMLMRATDMERDCAGCHKMTFNAAGVERTVPHADEDEVARILTDYFIAAAMEGGVEAENAPQPVKRKRRRRIAGENTSDVRAEQTGLSDAQRGQAIEWAQKEAIVQMDTLFGVRLCGNCHEAQKFPDQTGTERWKVLPAVLQREWMPRARFNHTPHEAMDCTSCHDAAKSEKASDILMVEQDTCRDCHDGTENGARADCVDCHEYHVPGMTPMSPEHAKLFQARADSRQRSPAAQQ